MAEPRKKKPRQGEPGGGPITGQPWSTRKGQRGAEDEQRRGPHAPAATRTRKGVSQNRSLYPGSRGERDYPTLSNLKKPEGQSIWALKGVGRGDRSILKKGAGKVSDVAKAGGKATSKVAKTAGRSVKSRASSVTGAIKGFSAIKPGGILRPKTSPSIKPKVAAKPRSSSTRKPASSQRGRRGVRRE